MMIVEMHVIWNDEFIKCEGTFDEMDEISCKNNYRGRGCDYFCVI